MNLRYIPIVICILLYVLPVNSYEIDPPLNVTHQHITNESQKVWPLIPYEIKDHLRNPISRDTSSNDYNIGDDIIDGSNQRSYNLGNGGTYASFSVANVELNFKNLEGDDL